MNKYIQIFVVVAMLNIVLGCGPQSQFDANPSSLVPKELLPNTLYYLGKDESGLIQVFRIERDGETVKQLTFESVDVKAYDISLVEGSVSYIADNKLFLVDADGVNRRLVIDGNLEDEPVHSPVFSPDGRTIAYAYKGLNLHDVSSGRTDLVLEAKYDELEPYITLVSYSPELYSPDGTKLLIDLGGFEYSLIAIYYLVENTITYLVFEDGEPTGYYGFLDWSDWSADGSRIYADITHAGIKRFASSSLWHLDINNGNVDVLLSTEFDNEGITFLEEPYLSSDNQLFFFFADNPQINDRRVPLQMVSSAPDAVTDRVVLHSDTFEMMNEALWAPDADFVIVVFALNRDEYLGGQAEIVYLDGRSNIVLTNYAKEMKWGP